MSLFVAYLDPGSGSALVGALIAVTGAFVYSLKSFFYQLIRRTEDYDVDSIQISIFSEGKNYWETFRLIIEELISRKIHFFYYTLDLYDPALQIDNEYMHSCLLDKNKFGSSLKSVGKTNF